MLPSITACTLTLLSALALASTISAAVLSSDPTADTRWKIGAPTKIRWRLSSPTPKDHLVTVYIVGGDPTAYKRYEPPLLSDTETGKHTWDIAKVPNVDCLDTCALEFIVYDLDGILQGDFYSHPFVISATGEAPQTTDKSAPVVAGSSQNAATPNGPITLIQNAAKGAQPQATTGSANTNNRLGAQGLATIAVAAAVSAMGMALF
ncbi:hypothetical protein K457DRAFT_124966 [Linnemannia elongata AG-77]|uniref:Uncharacterized protein n=1 Tax=Linnemannia elongata AG-77 TaxID=1314771 RepID=A0A197K2D0_9FUNG|nr:hypothetical protein K457DRAFT_124966 [Linnemannia elongata AG-77]